jgi:hypothetical protein
VGTNLVNLRMRLVQWRPNIALVLLITWGLFIVYDTAAVQFFGFQLIDRVTAAPLVGATAPGRLMA